MGDVSADRQSREGDGDIGGGEVAAGVLVLRRWEDSGGVWRVVSRSAGRVDVALLTCNAGEVMDRFTSTDPQVLDFIGARPGSDEPPP
jgi:hypothetical protein